MQSLSYPLPHLPKDPAVLCAKLRHLDNPFVFWLHNDGVPVIGWLPKVAWSLNNQDGLTLIKHTRTQDGYKDSTEPTDIASYQKTVLDYHHAHKKTLPNQDKSCFIEGLLGYVSYDVGANALNDGIGLSLGVLAFFGHYDVYLSQKNGIWHLCCNKTHLDGLLAMLEDSQSGQLPKPSSIALRPLWTRQDYQQAFDATQGYLKAGDAYQINLTQAFLGKSAPLYLHLPNLFLATHAPFCGYLAWAGQEILSVSPELFFCFYREGADVCLMTKPIKGTRPRHSDPMLDQALKQSLADSEKDLAENVMIVDLLRNDLGRYAKVGAVSVPKRFEVESFSNVHHMVSTVQACLDAVPALTVLFDSLPAGSITGSPKKRACELIDELEARPRGAYCGTMGYLNFDDTGQWNVLIRTLQGNDHEVNAWAGGGITVLSSCDEEYQECLDKIGQICQIVAQP